MSTVTDFWTSSRISTTRRCLRLAHYRYALGMGEPSSDTARFGTVGHSALEVGLLNYDADDRLDLSIAACDGLPDRYEAARLRASVAGYWVRWGSARWQVLAVEVQFRYLLGDVEMRGKIDGIVRDLDDGRVYVVEHKFTSMDASPGSAYWERLTIDTQVSIYTDGAAMLGYDIAGVIYDVIAKPGHKPAMATPEDLRRYTAEKRTTGKGCKACGGRAGGKLGPARGTGADCLPCNGSGWIEEPKHEPSRLYAGLRDTDENPAAFEARVVDAIAASPDTYYRRGVIVRLDDELPLMRGDILDTIKLARLASVLGMAPRNPDACAKFGTLCAFFGVCAGRDDINDAIRFPRGKAHSELAAPNP